MYIGIAIIIIGVIMMVFSSLSLLVVLKSKKGGTWDFKQMFLSIILIGAGFQTISYLGGN